MPHQSEMCEPCGGCNWCRDRYRFRRERDQLKAQRRRDQKLLAELAQAFEQEAELYRDGDNDSPHGAALRKLAQRARKASTR